MKRLRIFIVSDSIGETGELVARAAISQYRNGSTISIKRFPQIDTFEHLQEIAILAKEQRAMILYTLVKKEMREFIPKQCSLHSLHCIDLYDQHERFGEELEENRSRTRLVRKWR